MNLSDNEDLLQDFLVEAGEILEKLPEQLVDLERCPDNVELLNAIFRSFHTIKGGAGFLQLDPLIECCHKTENLFDILRNKKRIVDSELMDVTLRVLDAVNVMFSELREGKIPQPAPSSVLAALEKLISESNSVQEKTAQKTVVESAVVKNSVAKKTSSSATEACENITDQDFESFVASLHDMPDSSDAIYPSQPVAEAPIVIQDKVATNDEISDDDFELLLDQLHGKGSAPGTSSIVKTIEKLDKPVSEVAKIIPEPIKKSVAPTVSSVQEKKPVSVVTSENRDDDQKNHDHKTPGLTAENTVRVDTQRLDEIMNMVGELVLVRNRLVRLSPSSSNEAISRAIANLDSVTGDLQTSVMKTRMQPIKKVFGRFPRVVRDLARSLHKEVTLELIGEDTDLDKNLVEALADPLVHLVRNAVDHGIELPGLRESSGKSRQGTITLSAEQEGDHILLVITDDGAGMDAKKLRTCAVERGLLKQDAADRLSDKECFDLIFAPGFSTKAEISDVSGRGVGMDVVKTKIIQLNGLVQVDSTLGKGTRIIIKVPLTLAIMPTLMVMLGGQIFAFPLVSVNEIFNLDIRSTNIVDGQEVIVVREKTIPLFHLKRWLVKGADMTVSENSHVVVVSVEAQKVGFVVDQLIGQEEVVIKPLGKMLIGTPGVAGATITGDGSMALILDVPSMLHQYALQGRLGAVAMNESRKKIHAA